MRRNKPTHFKEEEMINQEWIDGLFKTIDAQDASAFAKYITANGQFRWGSAPAAVGTENIEQFVAGFFSTINALSHTIDRFWTTDEGQTVFVQGMTSYTMPNDAVVDVPFLNYFKMDGDLVEDYFVYADPSPMAAAMTA